MSIYFSCFLPGQEFNGRHALAAQQDVKSREGHHSTTKCHDQRFCAHQPQFRQERDVSLEGLELQQGDFRVLHWLNPFGRLKEVRKKVKKVRHVKSH